MFFIRNYGHWCLYALVTSHSYSHTSAVTRISNDSHRGPNFTLPHTASHCCTQLHTASHSFTHHHINSHCFTQLQHTVSHSSTLLKTASRCSTQIRIASQSFTLPHIACSVSLFLPPSSVSVCLSVSVRHSLSLSVGLSLSLFLLQFKTLFVVSSPTSTRPYLWSSLGPSCITLIRPENIPDH